MEPIEVRTSLGPVWFWGQDRGRPIALTITGAFADRNYLIGMPPRYPEVDVLRAHLPGNHCPELEDVSIAAYARAFDEALGQRFAGRVGLIQGVSVGALVALAMRAEGVRRLALVEPPLNTARAWPLLFYRKQTPPGGEAFLREILGVEGKALTGRDYRQLLSHLRRPADVILGDEPLMPVRDFVRMPSLVDDESRALLLEHPLVAVEIARGAGHNVPIFGASTYLPWLDRAVATAMQAPTRACEPMSSGDEQLPPRLAST